MTKAEFVKMATEYGYSKEDIDEMTAMIEQARNDGVPMDYDVIVLTEQPKY
jgi:hypothetical protein